MISPNLKSLVTQHLFLKTIESIEAFKYMPDLVEFVVSNIEAHQYQPEDYIIKQGQKATHVYILA